MHSANLILRFLLELAALAWRSTEGSWRFLAVIVVVVLIGAAWAMFAAPNDPSRSGNAPVPVP